MKYTRSTILLSIWMVLWSSFFVWLTMANHWYDLDQLPATTYPTHGTDSEQYTILAENLRLHHSFSLAKTAPFVPDGFRTLGYPLYLAVVKSIFHSYLPAIVLQMVMLLVSAWFAYKISLKLQLGKWSVIPPLFILCDPASIFYSFFLLSDTLFNFLLVISIWFLVKARDEIQKKKIITYAFSGLFLGLAVLVRPIAIFLPAVFIFAYSLWQKQTSFKKTIMELGTVIGVMLILVLPWLFRNHTAFNSWQLSSVGPVTFFDFTVPEFIHAKTGKSVADTRQEWHRQIGVDNADELVIDMHKTLQMMSIVKQALAGKMGSYILFHFKSTLPFFYTGSTKIFVVGLEPFRSREQWTQLVTYPKGAQDLRIHSLKDFGVLVAQSIFLLERLFWFLCFVLAVSALFLVKKHDRILALIMCGFMAYFAVLTGPVANERYRLPAVPFMAINLALVLAAKKGQGKQLDLSGKM